MPATLRRLAAPAASAFRPTGPAAIETLPPKVSEPAWANVLTALASLRMKTKSVSSKPICPPKPPPIVPMAEGADHDPSASLATTMPEPKRAVPKKPALKTVRMARPCVPKGQHAVRSRGTAGSSAPPHMDAWLSLGLSMCSVAGVTHFCIGKHRGRNDLVGPKRLSRVHERRQDLARLPALACHAVSDVIGQTMDRQPTHSSWKRAAGC